MKNKDQILLENKYQKVLENWRYYRGGSTPSMEHPDYYGSDEPECPVCGGPMYDAKRIGKSDKWEWDFRCKDENCEGKISGDNLP